MDTKNSHAFGYLGVFSFGMFLLGLVYQMLIGGRGFFGAALMGLIFAGIIAAIIYLFLMTSLGKDWSKVAAKSIEAKAGEVKAKVEQARAPTEADAETAPAPLKAAPVEDAVVAEVVEETVAEAAEPPTGKPATLSAPEGGTADDLKKIKGVGPKLEAVLNGMGYYHFHQIAAWNAGDVAWVDENLEGFKGRVSRDNWVAQAKELAG